MSVYTQWSNASDNRDAEGMIACLHDDYVFVRHQTGTQMNKTEMSDMLRAFMANDSVVVHEQRCLYENSEVVVEHSTMSFPDGTSEAILSFHELRDGQFVRSETGATPISK